MNRRGFFKLLGAGAVAAAVDPEKLLWTPGRKLISIPRPGSWITIWPPLFARVGTQGRPWYPVALMTPEQLEGLFLENDRLPKIGDTIRVRRPVRFRVNQPLTIELEPVDLYTRVR